MKRWLSRVHRAMQLDAELFEEVEHDHSAGPQALAVVLAASACGSIGNLLASLLLGERIDAWHSVIVVTAAFTIAWIAWSFVMMAVGTTIFGGVADMGEMQRALGFAAAPGLCLIIPGLGLIVGILWSLVAMVIAVRQALDFDTGRAIGTVAIGALVSAVIMLPTACFIHAQLGGGG